ncbi:hypothetical protein BUALT_Bualt08G0012300 [Buddleja alternifolia]|uniref:Uncharacterized protein n=1 Tax=Buddleja alternifolia TaxID=168488 RepID=A0AAV6X4G5_9LAMI|nr:hypothetical protein BUALT_Bualt08G0012300 [Buddleja alternifolia]
MSGPTANYRDDEDGILCQTYMEVSQDPITEISRTSNRFWARVTTIFNNSKNSSYADRGQRSLQCRYSDIEVGVKRLVHSIKHVESQNPSGASKQTILFEISAFDICEVEEAKAYLVVWNIVTASSVSSVIRSEKIVPVGEKSRAEQGRQFVDDGQAISLGNHVGPSLSDFHLNCFFCSK